MNGFSRLLLPAILLLSVSCSKDDNPTIDIPDPVPNEENQLPFDILVQTPALPISPFNYANPNLPLHFTAPPTLAQDNTPVYNPVTDWGATLGRVLFYDRNLSANNEKSCASCHIQELGFADSEAFSEGFLGGETGRNSMGLANARYYERGAFFWDERAATLEDQVLMPIQDAVEMGMDLDTLIWKIASIDYYPGLFANAFGDSLITADRVSRALAQFVRSMVSYQSPFDEGFASIQGVPPDPITPFPNFTDQQNLGKALFFDPQAANCASCHGSVNFVVPDPRNNGLDINYADDGLGDLNGAITDNGKFKSNSLRNIALTGPYMHDGRFATLLEVVEHYNSGVQPHPNLAPQLRVALGGPPRQLNLSEAEKLALVAFLETLSDPDFISDEKFANPFLQ